MEFIQGSSVAIVTFHNLHLQNVLHYSIVSELLHNFSFLEKQLQDLFLFNFCELIKMCCSE